MPKISFSREKKEIECEKGANLREVALANGVQLYPGAKRHLNCRGKGLCGECRVHVIRGWENLSPKTGVEKFRIGVSWFKFGHENEVRLACQARVEGDIEILTQPEFNWFGEAFR
ncbi:MAG TPA: 2Fe-2S iron-sulfur cluster-binding protein [Planctomycetota bacterium]|nr:2Fe-2S iron-sulfur cluster-binding protein [Planctomycetota bacterium]